MYGLHRIRMWSTCMGNTEIECGQRVWVTPKLNDRTKTWTKGTINKKVNIRSYEICMDEGQKLRRNRRDIRVSKCNYDMYTRNDNNGDNEMTDFEYKSISTLNLKLVHNEKRNLVNTLKRNMKTYTPRKIMLNTQHGSPVG